MLIDVMIYNAKKFFVKNVMIMMDSFVIFKIFFFNNKVKKMCGKIVKKVEI